MFATKVFAALVAASVVLAAPASQRSGSASGSASESASGSPTASNSGSSSASGTASSSAASSSSSSSSGDYSGTQVFSSSSLFATYYTVTDTGSACEMTVTDDDYVVALNKPQYTASDHCGDTVTITNTENGNTATAKVADECPECESGSLDMSPGLFGALK
ncbi:hypothetical protein I350_03941 [Cryptococcus amylolentus CBS 6273]|uniref:RlpA-like protein double-psi beta-barrel domain-containing protein n=1 Tax=Cryptococcus amylolentus CBS 6273 TaxID=1296118 RepID=A0A1E3K0L6_9TREE|nr:hypothetical protein I350_03941 [Cryptococcus amylolentus CBS 6273]